MFHILKRSADKLEAVFECDHGGTVDERALQQAAAEWNITAVDRAVVVQVHAAGERDGSSHVEHPSVPRGSHQVASSKAERAVDTCVGDTIIGRRADSDDAIHLQARSCERAAGRELNATRRRKAEFKVETLRAGGTGMIGSDSAAGGRHRGAGR